jgi:APA family basic amino acid/polyamine antiporter
MLHDKNLSPHRAIWTLAVISAIFGCIALLMVFGDGGAPTDATIAGPAPWVLVELRLSDPRQDGRLPNTLLTITLASNFGTFLLYMLSCVTCIFCYHNHPNFSFIKHMLIPVFGVVANLVCMAFYLIGPFMGYGTKMEPFLALGIAAVWAIYGGIYFVMSSKKSGKRRWSPARLSVM